MRTDFLKETEVLKKLSHPNILTIYEIYEDDLQFYLVTELCKGDDLYEEISKKGSIGFSERKTAKIMYEILLAIYHLHSENICHRDLKPENIIIVDEDKVKIIDFGTAEAFDPKSGMEGLIGTAYYIAPEVLEDTQKYNEKCDIWSLGVILYMMLTGQAPFNGRSENEIFTKIKRGIVTNVCKNLIMLSN